MSDSVTIAKTPNLPTAQDYLQLRQLALAFLQKYGNAAWTDYNLHDPGITLMELLAYGITDLSYRQDLPMASLLAVDINGDINGDSQALYTPAEILTISPLTINDYRLLLIDITGVQNAWLSVCKTVSGNCGWPLYVDCKTQSLSYSQTPNELIYGGLYDVQLQLDADTSLGNLNSGSVFYHFVLPYNVGSTLPAQMCGINLANNYDGYIEMRLPAAGLISTDPAYADFMAAGTVITGITGPEITPNSGNYGAIAITSNVQQNSPIPANQLQSVLGSSLYATFVIHYTDVNGVAGILNMINIPFRVYFYDSNGNMLLALTDLQNIISEYTAGGIMATYQAKLQMVETAVEKASYALNEHRNYCEDFCNITLVQTEDFAICCDIDATTDANLDELQEAIYAGIIRYLNPPLNFYSWEDLASQGYTIDQIFNGPRTGCGFVKPEDLANSGLRTQIFTADIIKIMYAIPGIIGVTNFTIVRIDANGNPVEFQPWQMNVTSGMLPNFYVYSSHIQFRKNSLPFNTDFSEILDSLSIISSAGQNPKLATVDLDVPLPTGQLLALSSYYPITYSLPPVYNVSPAGPMPPFTSERYAQAKQLQAYLLFFEQIYADWVAQIGGLKNFFNIEDPTLSTYLTRFITETDLPGVSALYASCYNPDNLQNNAESIEEFNDRKNRIYDHLMARLGENNNDYTMISNSLNNSLLQSPADILAEKARLLRKYPEESYRKARALNYKYNTTLTSSIIHEGLIDKLCDLLGLDSMNDFFDWHPVEGNPAGNYQLVGSSFNSDISISFSIYITVTAENDPPSVLTEGYYDQAIRSIDVLLDPTLGSGPQIQHDGNYYILGGFTAPGNTFNELCRITTPYSSLAAAWARYTRLTTDLNALWISNMILPIEHILLRPWSMNEPTLSTCIPEDCVFCGDEDPYSFRMTIIMCGESGFPGYNLDFRTYAEALIRTEVPAHILIKVCWLSEADCIQFSCLYRNYIHAIACYTTPGYGGGQTGSGSGYNGFGSGFTGFDNGFIGFGSGFGGFGSGLAGSGSGSGFVDWGNWVGGYNGCAVYNGSGSGSGSGSGNSECGCSSADVATARALLVKKLNEIRSIYPGEILNDCGGNNPAGLVYLGKTTI